MPTGYQIKEQDAIHFLTCTIVDWVNIFTKTVYNNIIIDSLNYCILNKGLEVYGYVIMTNHLHLLLRSPVIPLSDVIRDFKKFTAKEILSVVQSTPESRREWLLHRFSWNAAHNSRNSKYQVWQQDNHAELIVSSKFFEQKLNYIHLNPVRAGIVLQPEEFVYSSAHELSGRGAKIEIARIE